MVYAKFITATGKDGKPVKYGPYYYKSIRTPEGKVRNIYLGTKSAKKSSFRNLKQLIDKLTGLF